MSNLQIKPIGISASNQYLKCEVIKSSS